MTSPPDVEPGTEVAQTAAQVTLVASQLTRRLRAESDVPVHQLLALGRLAREGARTTSQLAAAERVRPQSMAQTVADLAAAGAVARRPDPADGRQILLEVTEAGRHMLDRERRVRQTWLSRRMAERLDGDERAVVDQAMVLLQRLLAP